MHGRQAIEDAGAALAGKRRDTLQTFGTPDDFIFTRWPKPDFAKAARSGATTPERAALFMAIYANVSPRPAPVSFGDGPVMVWPEMWRESIDLLRLMWETGVCHSIEEAMVVHDRMMVDKVGDPELARFVSFATGRMMKKGVRHGLALSDYNRMRCIWLPKLGWPKVRHLRDEDGFGIMRASERGGAGAPQSWHQPVLVSGARIEQIGNGERHATHADAEEALRAIVAKVLAERERDAALGTGAKALGKAGVRIGPDNPRRAGRNATTADLTGVLGMRAVEFGDFVGQRERQAVLNEAYDAYYDLCTILRVPAPGASLWGRASIAFGSRGMGANVSGHFEPSRWIVHMDRSHGSGVLAHEMGHAVDAAFAEAAGMPKTCLMSGGVAAGWRDHAIARMMADVLAEMIKGERGGPSMYLIDARKLDGGRASYWADPAEMFARLFEAWVHDSLAERGGRRNDFLVKPAAGAVAPAGLEWRAFTSAYPKGRERERMVGMMGEFLRAAIPMAQGRLEGRARLR